VSPSFAKCPDFLGGRTQVCLNLEFFCAADMQHRGRKSAAELAIPNVSGEPPRLDPPPSLTDAERSLFVEIVEACSPKHFVPSDLPLLLSFIQSTLLSRQAIQNAAKDAGALATWEKATRMQATLATRLRLAPQSRMDPKTLARQQPQLVRPPWEA
jgi:hypothetical protein